MLSRGIFIRMNDLINNNDKNLKFGDGDGPNLCRVKKVDVVSSTFENIYRSKV